MHEDRCFLLRFAISLLDVISTLAFCTFVFRKRFILRIKPKSNCIKYPGRQIAFNLLEPDIAQIRLLRRHRNTPHGRTLVCVYKTHAKLLFIFERHTLIS